MFEWAVSKSDGYTCYTCNTLTRYTHCIYLTCARQKIFHRISNKRATNKGERVYLSRNRRIPVLNPCPISRLLLELGFEDRFSRGKYETKQSTRYRPFDVGQRRVKPRESGVRGGTLGSLGYSSFERLRGQVMSKKKKIRLSAVCWWRLLDCTHCFFRYQFPNYKLTQKKK